MRINRRRFLRQGGLAAAMIGAGASSMCPRAFGAAGKTIGEAFDEKVLAYMRPREIPGAALAVVKDRRLVYAHAYGWADQENKQPARPDSLFRIASISKPFTAVAVLQLVAYGRLRMDAPAFELLQLEPLPGSQPDPRLKRMTVRHLLHHTGGWDRDKSGDPMFMSDKIARANGEPPPANQHAIIRYMLGQPLDFDPGDRYAYSNFGYCVLGRIIEKISGQGYESYMREGVLSPIGIRRMRLGLSRASGRAEGEVKYYMPRGAEEANTEPYTGFCLEAMDSHGAWIASAVDLARFAVAMTDPHRNAFRSSQPLPSSWRPPVVPHHTAPQAGSDPLDWLPWAARLLAKEPPEPPVSRNPDGSLKPVYYACGWDVRPIGDKGRANYWHTGSLPGTFTLLVRRHDGLSWAVLFNQRSSNSKLPDGEIDGALHEAADAVAEWPEGDLFEKYT